MWPMFSVVLVIASLGASSAIAVPTQDVTASFSPTYQACITYGEKHNTTAIPEGECDARELRLQDAKLNVAYKAVVARLSPVRKADLRTDERNWILARDQKCARQPDPDLKVECTIGETITRIGYLRRYR